MTASPLWPALWFTLFSNIGCTSDGSESNHCRCSACSARPASMTNATPTTEAAAHDWQKRVGTGLSSRDRVVVSVRPTPDGDRFGLVIRKAAIRRQNPGHTPAPPEAARLQNPSALANLKAGMTSQSPVRTTIACTDCVSARRAMLGSNRLRFCTSNSRWPPAITSG